ALQRLRQALLKVTDPTTLTRGRRAGALGPDLRLRGLGAPRHRSLLASRPATADDRLCEPAILDKGTVPSVFGDRAETSGRLIPEGQLPAGTVTWAVPGRGSRSRRLQGSSLRGSPAR